MKENWMNKLVDLLNEYEKEKTDLKFNPHLWDAYGGHLSFLEYSSKYSDLLCISKRYEFIKRLVDNDKINYHKISDIIIYSQWRYTWVNKTTAQRVDENYLDLILMILSIQDNPIQFLIDILA